MTNVLFLIDESIQSKTDRIAISIQSAIRAGRLNPGELLPSSRALAADFGSSRQTVLRALENLISEGWIISEQRKSYRVADILPDDFSVQVDDLDLASTSSGSVVAKRLNVSSEESSLPAVPVRWNFRSGRSDLRLLPIDEIRDNIYDAMRFKKSTVLDYGHPDGYPVFVNEIRTYLRKMRAIQHRDLLITHGCQEAIYLTSRVLLSPGDKVAVEALSYPIAMSTFRAQGLEMMPVEMDEYGMDPNHFETICRRHSIKLVFLTPNHQFPTTVTMSVQRRHEIYSIAAKYSVIILEDDFDHEYHFSARPPHPFASIDTHGLVIYISSLSKVMFPGARIGFMALPVGVKSAFMREKMHLNIQCSLLMQDAIARWMRSGKALMHLNKTRRIYHERLLYADHILGKMRDNGLPIEWRVPEGGMALWVKTPWDTAKIAQEAEAQGIFVQYEQASQVNQMPGCHFRIGYARHTEEELLQGLDELFALAQSVGRMI